MIEEFTFVFRDGGQTIQRNCVSDLQALFDVISRDERITTYTWHPESDLSIPVLVREDE